MSFGMNLKYRGKASCKTTVQQLLEFRPFAERVIVVFLKIHSSSPSIFYFQLMQGLFIWLFIDGNLKVWLNSGESNDLVFNLFLFNSHHKEAF